MILTYTYAELAAAMQDWPEDDDADYVAQIPKLIAHGELKLTRELDIDIFEAEDSTPVITSGNPIITKPTNMVAARLLSHSTGANYRQLEQRTPDYIRQYNATATNGLPIYYAELSQTEWLVAPPPNFTGVMTVRLTRRVAGLDSGVGSSTSWLSTNIPDLLLWACLISAHIYLKNDPKYKQMTQDYANRFPMVAAEIAKLRKKNAVGRSLLMGMQTSNASPTLNQAE